MKFSRENILTIYFMHAALFLSAIRWRTGTDWVAYVDVFENIDHFGIVNEFFEPGLIVVMKLMNQLGVGFSGYILVLSMLSIGIKLFVISRLPYWRFGLLWYGVTFQFDLYSVRYNAALSLFLLGLYLREHFGRPRVSWLFFSLGILWHKVILVGILLGWPRSSDAVKISLWVRLLLSVCFAAAALFFVNQDSFKYKLANQIFSFNLNLSGLADPVYIHRLLYLAVCLLIAREMYRVKNGERSIHAFVPILGGAFYCVIGVVELGSISRIFGIFLILELYIASTYRLANRNVILFGFALFVFPVRLYQFFISNYFDLFWPYETILEHHFKSVY